LNSINGSIKIKPVIIKFQGKSGKLIVRRMIPLIHSWAVTVHKMQGATLTKVVVDLYGGFDYGMEYVSLSRVKSLEGLAISKIKISRFLNNKFTCPKALNEIKRQKERCLI
jgi:ATP-dependent exoDNAse (exonuclease V) alpha subunit